MGHGLRHLIVLATPGWPILATASESLRLVDLPSHQPPARQTQLTVTPLGEPDIVRHQHTC